MSALVEPPPSAARLRTLADLLADLGDLAPARIVVDPAPGLATEADLTALLDRKLGLFELVDGTIVAKPVGIHESLLALALGGMVRAFVIPRNLGIVTGPDGALRLALGLVRIPDIAFIAWVRFPGQRLPALPVPGLAPDLAIEVLSESNTRREMARKRRDSFAAGTRLVWEVDPKTREVAVFHGPETSIVLNESQTLDGGDVLPGFALPLAELFAELDRQGD